MIVLDVNVLVSAFRPESPHHGDARAWIERSLGDGTTLALSPVVISGFLRVVTAHRIFEHPSTLGEAWSFVDTLRGYTAVVDHLPGPDHVRLLQQLTLAADARANLVSDAAIAALALEVRASVASFDRDFLRFPEVTLVVPTS